MNCPSCSQPVPPGAQNFCPHCGFAIAGLKARQGWILGNLDLRKIARKQRLVLLLILAEIGLYFGTFFLGNGPALRTQLFGVGLALLMLILHITMVVIVIQLMAAMNNNLIVRILAGLLAFAPCISLLILLMVNRRATNYLQQAGLKVGLLGVTDEQLTRLLNTSVCHACGYSLYGLESANCPECGAPLLTRTAAGPPV